MNRFIKRCTSALSVTAVGVMLTTGFADASYIEPGPEQGTSGSIQQIIDNNNSSTQTSSPRAQSRQGNDSGPISFLTVWSGNGDVDQSNKADNTAISIVGNSTDQSASQHAKQDVDGGSQGHGPRAPHGAEPQQSLDQGTGGDTSGAIGQTIDNGNSNQQSSSPTASSEQGNLNVPISVLTVATGNGDVDQSNKADNTAVSVVGNSTDQSADQHAKQDVDGGRDTHGKPHEPKPGKDWDGPKGEGPKGDGGTSNGAIDQSIGNTNSSEQSSSPVASSKQDNVNLPVSVLSVSSNNGDVDQSNKADNEALSVVGNETDQSADQHAKQDVDGQDGHGGWGGKDGATSGVIDQGATNSNDNEQTSSPEASSKQANVNLPVSILSVDSNNGDVDQSNKADNEAVSVVGSDTDQSADQHAKQDVEGGKSDGTNGQIGQNAGNTNSNDQTSTPSATGNQVNVNAPISVLSVGANNGDVDQSNHASNGAGSFVGNGTSQSAGQSAYQIVG